MDVIVLSKNIFFVSDKPPLTLINFCQTQIIQDLFIVTKRSLA